MHSPMHPRGDADEIADTQHTDTDTAAAGAASSAEPEAPSEQQAAAAAAAVSRGRDMAAATKPPVSTRFLQSTQSADVKKKQREAEAPAQPLPRQASGERKLTIPVAPKLRCGSRPRGRMASSEEQELHAIQEARRAEAERKRRNQRSLECSMAKSSIPAQNAVQSTKPLTVPITPCNNLSKRHGTKTYSTTHVSKPAPPTRPTSAPTGPKLLTQPEPFVLSTGLRAGSSQGPVEAAPTAGELRRQFEADPRSSRVPNAATRLTEAQSPMLRTKTRATSAGRPLPKSHEQTEEQLMAEAGKKQWRAKPVDKRVFDSHGELGVSKVAAKPMTVCEAFTFRYNEVRALQRRQAALASKEKEEEALSAFKAAPMPDFETCAAAAAPHSSRPLTVGLSPKLSGGPRSSSAPARRQRPHHGEVERERKQRKAAEVLRSRRPMMLTDPQGFHLSTSDRGKMSQAMLAQRMEEEKAEEQKRRNFKAKALDFQAKDRNFVPQPSTKELTDFNEFHLESDRLRAVAASKMAREEETRLAEENAKTNFRARSVPKAVVNLKAAFKVHKDEKPTTRPVTMCMATDERAKKRHEFQKEMNRKKQEQAKYQAQLEMDKERDEVENLNLLRRKPIAEGGMCFKAAARPGDRQHDACACAAKPAGEKLLPARESGPSENQGVLSEQSLNSFAAVVPVSEGL
jgi:hypothetical protein